MDGFSIISYNIILMALMILLGYTSVKTGYIPSNVNNMLSKVIVRITLPLLIVNSLTQVTFDYVRIRNSIFVIVSAITVIAFLYFSGFVFAKIFRLPKATAFIHQSLTAFGNVVFLGYPLISALYGADGLFYAALYAFVNDMFVWTYVVWRFSALNNAEKKSLKETIKDCLNPPTIAFIISFIMIVFKIQLGGVLKDVANTVGSTTTPLAMLFIGATLAESRLLDKSNLFHIFFVVLIKMILVPLLLILITKNLPFDDIVKGVIILQAAVPSQTILSILTKEYNGDSKYVVKGILITTLSGLVTLPFIYYLLTIL